MTRSRILTLAERTERPTRRNADPAETTSHANDVSIRHAVALAGQPGLAASGIGTRAGVVGGLQRTIGNQAVTRLMAQRQTAAPAVQRRMDWQNTDWNRAQSVTASSGGSLGVLFVNDNSTADPIVVKAGERASVENTVAANLFSSIGKKTGGLGKWRVTAPGLRPLEEGEAAQAKASLSEDKIVGDGAIGDRARNLIGMLDQPGAMVGAFAGGQELQKGMQTVTHSKQDLFGKNRLKKSSVARNLFKPAAAKSLGMAAAGDIFTGNKDRISDAGRNFENLKLDVGKRDINLIDNIAILSDQSTTALKDSQNMPRRDGNGTFDITARGAFERWKADEMVQMLAVNDFDGITAKCLTGAFFAEVEFQTTRVGGFRAWNILEQRIPAFKAAFAAGLAKGKARIMATSVNKLLRGVGNQDRGGVSAALRARLTYLETGDDIQWGGN